MKRGKAASNAKKAGSPDLNYMARYIWLLFLKIDVRFFDKPTFSRLYLRLLNPFNYALVGGIGVFINYGVWSGLLWLVPWLPWWLINALAIIIAWSWNWANSVGPLGWFWGFKKRT